MNDIIVSCNGANASGIRRLKLIGIEDVQFIRKPQLNVMDGVRTWMVMAGGLKLKPTAKIVKVGFVSGSASMAETMVEDEGGILFQTSVDSSVNLDNADYALSVSMLVGRGLIGLIEDRNGIYKILGDLHQPLRLINNVVSVGANERTLGFGCRMNHQAYFIETIKDEFLF